MLPLLFILVFGLFVGESFGQKPDNRLRIMLVDLDRGSGLQSGEPWSQVVRRDLAETAGIRVADHRQPRGSRTAHPRTQTGGHSRLQ